MTQHLPIRRFEPAAHCLLCLVALLFACEDAVFEPDGMPIDAASGDAGAKTIDADHPASEMDASFVDADATSGAHPDSDAPTPDARQPDDDADDPMDVAPSGHACSVEYALPGDTLPLTYAFSPVAEPSALLDPFQLVFDAPSDGLYAFEVSYYCIPSPNSGDGAWSAVPMALEWYECGDEMRFVDSTIHYRRAMNGRKIRRFLDLESIQQENFHCYDVVVHVDPLGTPPSCGAPAPLAAGADFTYGYTASAKEGVASPCGRGSHAAVYTFTAPSSGRYIFDAHNRDLVLQARDGSCAGDWLTCTVDGRVRMDLTAGQGVALLVEPKVSGIEQYRLTATPERASCAAPLAIDLSGASGLDPTFGWDDRPAPRDAVDERELVVSFTAPDAGTYCFTAAQANWPIDIELLGGGDCSAPSRAFGTEHSCCSIEDRATTSFAALDLAQGESVLAVVHGRERRDLDYMRRDDATGFPEVSVSVDRCDGQLPSAEPLPSSATQSLAGETLVRADDALQHGSRLLPEGVPCAGMDAAYATKLYRFVPPVTGRYLFDASQNAGETLLGIEVGTRRICGEAAAASSVLAAELLAGVPAILVVQTPLGATPFTLDLSLP